MDSGYPGSMSASPGGGKYPRHGQRVSRALVSVLASAPRDFVSLQLVLEWGLCRSQLGSRVVKGLDLLGLGGGHLISN